MLIYVQVIDGAVVNRAVFNEPMPNDWENRSSWYQSGIAQIGWVYADGVFEPIDEPVALEE